MPLKTKKYAVKNKKCVAQKYLEPGHTQMECDAVHSLIERKLNSREITLPYDYVTKTREARQKPTTLNAEILTHEIFKNYDNKDLMRYRSIRPERCTNDPTVNNLRELHYSSEGTIGYKTDFSDQIRALPQRSKEINDSKYVVEGLFQDQLKISAQKFAHLQDIKSTLAPEFHGFYDSLQFKKD
ncbi:unnamed protein product [Psylliodes chrysocephalus]|uniref:Uncharacterized protein n=1 Tax=Psylliodes chrysocephalus TaxID=3402493 RepID=A0A9P0GAK1_9CUCU|nr:unnamed protein product [Psylliodes chrysocephala]